MPSIVEYDLLGGSRFRLINDPKYKVGDVFKNKRTGAFRTIINSNEGTFSRWYTLETNTGKKRKDEIHEVDLEYYYEQYIHKKSNILDKHLKIKEELY